MEDQVYDKWVMVIPDCMSELLAAAISMQAVREK